MIQDLDADLAILENMLANAEKRVDQLAGALAKWTAERDSLRLRVQAARDAIDDIQADIDKSIEEAGEVATDEPAAAPYPVPVYEPEDPFSRVYVRGEFPCD